MELLHENLRLVTLRNRFQGSLNRIKAEIGLREQTRKKTDNIERLKTEVEEWEFENIKLLQDLNNEKSAEIFEIIRIEKRLEALKTSKTIINA